MPRRALILFGHGARDPRWAAPFERLQEIIQSQQPGVAVKLAFLELMSPSLPDVVEQLAQAGCDEVTVVPVFLGQSGHVLRDVPPLIDGLRSKHPGLRLKLAGAVGEDADVLLAIARYCIDALTKP